MSSELALAKMEQTLAKHDKTLDEHDAILKGDHSKYPPEPGVMDILKEIAKQLSHPKSGNEALLEQVTAINNKDTERVSYFRGARLVAVLLWGGFTFLAGILVKLIHWL